MGRKSSDDKNSPAASRQETMTPDKAPPRGRSNSTADKAATKSATRTKRAHSDASEQTSTPDRRGRAESEVSIKSAGSNKSSSARKGDRSDSNNKNDTNNETKATRQESFAVEQDSGVEVVISIETPKRKKSESGKKKRLTPNTNESSPGVASSPNKKSDKKKVLTEEERLAKRSKRREKRLKSKSKKSASSPIKSPGVGGDDNADEPVIVIVPSPRSKSKRRKIAAAVEPQTDKKDETRTHNESRGRKVEATGTEDKMAMTPLIDTAASRGRSKSKRKERMDINDATKAEDADKSAHALDNAAAVRPGHSKSRKRDAEVTAAAAAAVVDKEAIISSGPKVDVAVHRVRCMEFHPKPILCIRATPPRGSHGDYLAISRDNGSVEIRAANEKLRVITTVAGNRNKPATVMTWICGCSANKTGELPSLVGGCRDGSLFIVDAGSGSVRGMMLSGGGGVFSLVSLCQRRCCEGNCCQLVAAGCEDGSIRLFKIDADAATLELVMTVPPTGGAILSLAWIRKRTSPHESSMFVGVADGTIRRYDFSAPSSNSLGFSGSCKPSVRMTVESLGRTTPTRVWALEALSDGTVVSVDSLGHVQFWDGNTGTLEQSFDQNDNKADVLCVAITADENMVFASGVDSRVVCIERPSLASGLESGASKWVITSAQRPHTHDVNALAIHRVNHPGQPMKELLTSGGVDTKLSLYDTNNFQKGRPRVLYPWIANSISVAVKARVFSMMRENVVDVFKLGDRTTGNQLPLAVPENDTLIGSIEISGTANLICAAISDDAKFLAVADATTLYIFKLTVNDGVLKPEQLKVEIPRAFVIQVMCFLRNNTLIVAAGDERLYAVEISQACHVKALTSREGEKVAPPLRGSCAVAIHASKCGDYVATVRCGMKGSSVDIFKKDSDDLFRFWWTLPPLEIGVSTVSFVQGDELRIAACCSDFSLYVFDVARREVDQWSEAAGYPVSSSLPIELKQRTDDYPVRLFHDPSSPHKLFMGSFGAFAVFDLNERFPRDCLTFPETHVRGKKRKRAVSTDETDASQSGVDATFCKLCLRYNSMLHLGYVGEAEMLVVEQPWLSIVATFPPALQRRVYGS